MKKIEITKSNPFSRFFSRMGTTPLFITVVLSKIVEAVVCSVYTIEFSKLVANLSNQSLVKSYVAEMIGLEIFLYIWGIVFHNTTHLLSKAFNRKQYHKLTEKAFQCKLHQISQGEVYAHICTVCDRRTEMLVQGLMLPCSLAPAMTIIVKLIMSKSVSAVSFVILAVLISGAAAIVGQKLRYTTRKKLSGQAVSANVDCITNMKTFRFLGKESFAINRLAKLQNAVRDYNSNLARRTIFGIADTGFIIPLYIAVLFIAPANRVEVGTLLLTAINSLGAVVNICTNIFDAAADSRDSKETISVIFDAKEERKASIKSGLKLKKLKFGFKRSDNTYTEFRVDDITLEYGHRYCITGESGQGKSSLAAVIAGGIPTLRGEINPVKTFYVYQDSAILNMTLRENITFGNEAITDDDIMELAGKLGLSNWINYELENGLDTMCGEHGAKCSTGQCQRINVMRSIFKMREHDDDTLIILDEPTSNLDNETEKLVVKAFDEECTNTLLVITHRPAIENICDRHITVSNHVFKEV